jgi:hypothetical protein
MRGLSNSTKELLKYAHQLLSLDHPQTLRQLHYAIFSRQEIPYQNTQADYKRLSRATTVARRSYRAWQLAGAAGFEPEHAIPPQWMVDETRQPERVNVWQDSDAYIDTVKRAYRRDNWQDQLQYCEVWSEKATILGAIRPVADQWGITLRVCHGFGSTGMEAQVGTFFEGCPGRSRSSIWATTTRAATRLNRICIAARKIRAESTSAWFGSRFIPPTSVYSNYLRRTSRPPTPGRPRFDGNSGATRLLSNWMRFRPLNYASASKTQCPPWLTMNGGIDKSKFNNWNSPASRRSRTAFAIGNKLPSTSNH